MDVDRMLSEINVRQFRTWRVYYELEPPIEQRIGIYFANVVQTLANLNRGRFTPPYSLKHFLLPFGDLVVEKEQTWEEQKAIAQLWVIQQNTLTAADEQENRSA